LTVQFWDLYSVCNEKTKCVPEVWVEGELRLSFRRTFTYEMMQSWEELMSIVETVALSSETDALVWVYNTSGTYSSQSFYATIDFRGVTPVYIPAVWTICVPPKIHLFYGCYLTIDWLQSII
jgi:hypothetical protein